MEHTATCDCGTEGGDAYDDSPWRQFLVDRHRGLDLIEGWGSPNSMRTAVKIYVSGVVAAAVLGTVVLGLTVGSLPLRLLGDALILCALGLSGELLGFVLPHKARGSVSYIPYFAAVALAPTWATAVAITAVRVGLECFIPRPMIKRALNASAYALMAIIAIVVYRALGGVSLAGISTPSNLTSVARDYGFAGIAAFTIGFFANNFIVFAAIALASGRPVSRVLVEASRSTVVIDLITSPLIFVFAWVYAAFGPIAAAALWVPILGLSQVHRINLELERTNEELLELMVKSLEARDPYTSGHSRRVQQYSMTIARAVGLSESQVSHVGHAALLHDVGKIYEKYAPVLAKQDRLTPEEWAIIQDHPADGANLVATMSRLRDMVPAIRHHHENWDGTGYPDGLAGELIPLASRIIRFADTIDAMTTERPYRRPLTEVQVRAEVVRCRGTQFDPTIADRLLSSALWSTLFAPVPHEPVKSVELTVISGKPSRSLTGT